MTIGYYASFALAQASGNGWAENSNYGMVHLDDDPYALLVRAYTEANHDARRLHAALVRKTPSWPRSWANFSFLPLYSHRNVWANLHLLGQPNTFLADGDHR